MVRRAATNDSDLLRGQIAAKGTIASIPLSATARRPSHSAATSTLPATIERFFGKLKHAKGPATRYDKRAIKILSPRIWIKAYESTV